LESALNEPKVSGLPAWLPLYKSKEPVFDQILAFAAGSPVNVVNPEVLDQRRVPPTD